ncbi:MAG: FAD-binding protein [Firmicutes bacterium]|nr:FAD-binding protein [Bacillota bacterium]
MKLTEHHYDVVCIGGGAAGLVASLEATAEGASVALVSKEPAGGGNTRLSGGGIAMDGEPEVFARDVLSSGEGLSEPALVKVVTEDSLPAALLLERLGLVYNKREDRIILGIRAGHGRPRTGHLPNDGVTLGRTLREAVIRQGLDLYDEMLAFDLLVPEGVMEGILCHDLITGEYHLFHASAVILATGGAGCLFYPQTDNARGVCGDGLALALKAGVGLIDLEQIQFLPFAITKPSSARGVYCGEPSVVGGPRGILRNGDGKPLLDMLNRRTRAEVAGVMWREMSHGRPGPRGGLILDLRDNLEPRPDNDAPWDSTRVNIILKTLLGGDCYRGEQPYEVAPTAHYFMGGIKSGTSGETRVPGLFVAGEAMGGIHGANRLAGVALTETAVFGSRAGKAAATYAAGREGDSPQGRDPVFASPSDRPAARFSGRTGGLVAEKLAELAAVAERRGTVPPVSIHRALGKILWDKIAGLRTEAGCESVLTEIAWLRKRLQEVRIPDTGPFNRPLWDYLEAEMMLPVAEAITLCARERRESRGAHLREDYPDPDPALAGRRIAVFIGPEGMAVRWEEVPQ